MLAETTAFTLDGISARPVRVEVDVHRGLPSFQIVGLPDAAVREARERVRAALVNCGYEFPLRRITANLAPADLRKVGPGLDLALATALLGANGEIPAGSLADLALAGELALDGSVRPVRGALAMAEAAGRAGKSGFICPDQNGREASLAAGIEVRTVGSLAALRSLTRGTTPGERPAAAEIEPSPDLPDIRDLRGQEFLCSAMEVAAAGGHGLLMVGPPGAGKSLAARRMPSILPPLTGDEVLEVARIASACGTGNGQVTTTRPFRAPHHTVSAAGLVGGGSPPRPGEITLAHSGVLFLDELCEFSRPALEALREPLESGQVSISRAGGRQTLPSRFMLVAAANPCPCGRGQEDPGCECSAAAIRRYRARLTGALTDRIDMTVAVSQPESESMLRPAEQDSAAVRLRVVEARAVMADRYGDGTTNAAAAEQQLERFGLERAAADLLSAAHRSRGLSGRAHARAQRLARTIADLDGGGPVTEAHMARALQLRRRTGK
ncbi:MAG: YifB family Mg chelatase-like AAA ATPase [Acidobacteriota bacterium]